MVRALLFATIRTFHVGGWRQTMVAAPHVPLGRRGFSFGNRHGGIYSFIGPNLRSQQRTAPWRALRRTRGQNKARR